MLKVKICGIKREEDLKKAVELNFDAIGFILCESKRQVSLDEVINLSKTVPPFYPLVAVVKDPSPEEIERIVRSHIFTHIQFHGTESPELIKKIPLKTIKAIPISEKGDINLVKSYIKVTDMLLFDTKVGEETGGTGTTFNWSIIRHYNREKPFILAGGIGIHNVIEAVKIVKPDAIDVNSSLEVEPGVKDHSKMEKLIKLVRLIKED